MMVYLFSIPFILQKIFLPSHYTKNSQRVGHSLKLCISVKEIAKSLKIPKGHNLSTYISVVTGILCGNDSICHTTSKLSLVFFPLIPRKSAMLLVSFTGYLCVCLFYVLSLLRKMYAIKQDKIKFKLNKGKNQRK